MRIKSFQKNLSRIRRSSLRRADKNSNEKVVMCGFVNGKERQKMRAKLSRIIIHGLAYCQGQFRAFFSSYIFACRFLVVSVNFVLKSFGKIWISSCDCRRGNSGRTKGGMAT